MATTYKYKVHVRLTNGNSIYPIIEAASSGDAQRIAKAQYPTAFIGSALKIA